MKNKMVVLQIDPRENLEDVWKKLEEAGCSMLYSNADEISQHIYCNLPLDLTKQNQISSFPEIISIENTELPEIDWNAQWAEHAQGYREGYLHLDLKTITQFPVQPQLLKLKPGPGFGDLSHPTTRLVLKLMPSVIQGKNIIDIGCGSGILSLAAAAMGASSVCGIDIEDEALIHSRINSKLNSMENSIDFMQPEEYCKKIYSKGNRISYVCLMNMIQSEQRIAWNSLIPIHKNVSTIISSGILVSDCAAYIEMCNLWGFIPIKEIQEDGWIAYHLVKK